MVELVFSSALITISDESDEPLQFVHFNVSVDDASTAEFI